MLLLAAVKDELVKLPELLRQEALKFFLVRELSSDLWHEYPDAEHLLPEM